MLQRQWLNTQNSRELHHIPKQCPSDHGYVENYEVQEYGALPFPSLFRESVDMVILSSIVLGEIASILVAESHHDMDMETRDPLSAHNNFNTSPNITLVDLSNMNSPLNGLADMDISELKSAISNIVEDP